jgi:hypothetical protein
MDMDESAARISMATPPIDDFVLQYRAFCIGEMLIQRIINNGQLKKNTQNTWGEIRRSFTFSKGKVIAQVHFNGSRELFPLEIPMKALVGHKDSIVQNVRKVERDLPSRLEAWSIVTKNGFLRFESSQELLLKMNKYHKKASWTKARVGVMRTIHSHPARAFVHSSWKGEKEMDHMKSYWTEEMLIIQQTVSKPDTIEFSNHLVQDRMVEREVSLADIGFAFLTGQIYEGYDIGQYPKYRNPDPLRTVCGTDSHGQLITVGVALKSSGKITVTTVYKGVPQRLKHFFQ